MEDAIARLQEDTLYEEIAMVELEFKDTVDALFDGKIILLSTYENDKSKDVLIRFRETRNGTVTQITKPSSNMSGFTGVRRYWSLHDVSLNTLSMFPTYVYDPAVYKIGNKYEPKTTVYYTTDDKEEDVAIIKNVYRDEECNFYYRISGEGELMFKEEDLSPM